MADSNQFHIPYAVALDTEPPIFYMNDVSRVVIALIVEYNAYTFPKSNANIFILHRTQLEKLSYN